MTEERVVEAVFSGVGYYRRVPLPFKVNKGMPMNEDTKTFPGRFGEAGESGSPETERIAVRESIETILTERIGGRRLPSECGCRLIDPGREWLDTVGRELLCEEAVRAIGAAEHRVSGVRAVFDRVPGSVKTFFLRVSWVMASTGQYDELVLPFPFDG